MPGIFNKRSSINKLEKKIDRHNKKDRLQVIKFGMKIKQLPVRGLVLFIL